eukprot:scaffold34010_cov75-Phaeocystis_antarctica.AAC.1
MELLALGRAPRQGGGGSALHTDSEQQAVEAAAGAMACRCEGCWCWCCWRCVDWRVDSLERVGDSAFGAHGHALEEAVKKEHRRVVQRRARAPLGE